MSEQAERLADMRIAEHLGWTEVGDEHGYRFNAAGDASQLWGVAPGMTRTEEQRTAILGRTRVPCFSTRIQDAWLVVEAMRERGYFFEMSITPAEGPVSCQVYLCPPNKADKPAVAQAPTAPAAIVAAALKALEGEHE